MNKAYLLLGSNIGDTKKNLNKAKKQIENKIGSVTRSSSLYSTKAWGYEDQDDFMNQVLIVTTALSSIETMMRILEIEKNMGRVRTLKNAPRLIDIDILFFNKEIIHTEDLIIPHPLMQKRKFVMVPLNELSPNFIHPVLKKNIHQIMSSCKDKLTVNKI
jgi:2-amino-4-hydroxy-6-hydroxymethyldihydropteridine diphosphokinase